MTGIEEQLFLGMRQLGAPLVLWFHLAWIIGLLLFGGLLIHEWLKQDRGVAPRGRSGENSGALGSAAKP